ncbi:MAG TPA: HAMP domain-containing histidine kinase [Anaerolineae bacterium]|nr:HAMP domain-containing histidine kinase [Anaerolineae bacterium]
MNSWWLLPLIALTLVFVWLWRREASARLHEERRARQLVQDLEADLSNRSAERDWLEAAATASFHLMMVIDRDLRVHYANESMQMHFGTIPEGATLIGYTRNLALEQLARETIESGTSEALERDISFDGPTYRARAVLLDQGVGMALTDISEFQRLSRARQHMVANLSHELRTPLTSLRLLTDTLRSPTGQNRKIARDLLAKIVGEVDTLEQIAGEMLDLAAIESGRQVVRLVPLLLKEVVAEPVARLADQAERGRVEFVVDISPQVQVLADKDQAARAIQNVLHNAVKFSPAGGQVRITASTERVENQVVLSIEDNGPGIHPDELERVFERFYRSDKARGTPGTGLGLSIAKHIMEAHGGHIWVENRPPPENGAIFHLVFKVP